MISRRAVQILWRVCGTRGGTVYNISASQKYLEQSRLFFSGFSTIVKDEPVLARTSQPAQTHHEHCLQLETDKDVSDRSQRITEAADVDSVLDVGSQNLDIKVASLCLRKLALLCVAQNGVDADISAIFKDPRFEKLAAFLHGNVKSINHWDLVTCVRALLSMSDHDIFLMQSLETNVLWHLRKMPVKLLISVLQLHDKHQETALRQKVFQESLATAERRWVEISATQDLLTLMYLFEGNSITLFRKLEDRALDLAETMSPKDLYKVLYLLARRNHGNSRNTPLIRAVVYHINKNRLALDLVHLKNLLFACYTLNIFDTNLLEKISRNVTRKITPADSPNVLAAIFTSFGMLRWKNVDVLNVVLLQIEKKLTFLSDKELVSILLSMARLDLGSADHHRLAAAILDRLDGLAERDPVKWLDVVWSLAVLKCADESLISSVLGLDFYDRLLDTQTFAENTHKLFVSQVKLMNIEGAAKLDLSDYKGIFLPPDWSPSDPQIVSRQDRTLADSVVTALDNMAPLNRFMRRDVTAPYGYLIDAELFVNTQGQPQSYQDALQNPSPEKFRVALKVLDFYDMTLSTQDPTGQHVMAVRHLRALGYNVQCIPYCEWSAMSSVVQRVKYLEAKIKSALSPSPAEIN